MILSVILLILLAVLAGCALVIYWVEARRRTRPPKFSPVAAEMAAMQAAWRVRDAELAAERHMDEFIAERRAQQRGAEPIIIEGEVIATDGRRWHSGWPQ